nr:MAG TPA: hypothetical protein [Caudoviricetes sp.]
MYPANRLKTMIVISIIIVYLDIVVAVRHWNGLL